MFGLFVRHVCVAYALLDFGGASALAAQLQRFCVAEGPAALGGCVWRTDTLVLDALHPDADPRARTALARAPAPAAAYLRYASARTAHGAEAAVAALVDGGGTGAADARAALPLGAFLRALLHYRAGDAAHAAALAAEARAAACEWRAPACAAQAAWLEALLAARGGASPLRVLALQRASSAAAVASSGASGGTEEWAPSFEGVGCALQLALVHAATAGGGKNGPRARAQRCVDAARAAALALRGPARALAVARIGYVEATLHAAWGLTPLAAHVRTPLQHAVFLAAAGRHAEALQLLHQRDDDGDSSSMNSAMESTRAGLAAAVALSRALQTGAVRRARELVPTCGDALGHADAGHWLPRIAAGAPGAAVRGLEACARAHTQPDALARAAARQALLGAGGEAALRTLRAARALALCRALALGGGALGACTVALAEGALRARAPRLALALLDAADASGAPLPAPVAAAAHVARARAHLLCVRAAPLPAVRTALLQRAAAEAAAACAQCRTVDDVPGLAGAAHLLALVCHALRWTRARNAAAAEWLRCQHRLSGAL